MNATFSWRLLAPRLWPSWLVVAFVFFLAMLPWFIQKRIGLFLGCLVYRYIGQRVEDTRTNLRLCFPEKSDDEREKMVKQVFLNAGLTIFEVANAWFKPLFIYRSRFTLKGFEHVQKAQAENKAVLLLGAHYSVMDLGAALASLYFKVDTVYRPQENPVFNWISTHQRQRMGHGSIPHSDMRGLMRALKAKHIVWYTPDQDFGARHSVFVPFFGSPAATITMPSRLAESVDCYVATVCFHRNGLSNNYSMEISAPLENFPSGDVIADATRINLALEACIKKHPTQYMWYHRRFKSRPEGAEAAYPPKRPRWQK